ncbi:MAG TPA: hypothetical protein VG056_00530 [Pirellulales bacterium]|nr:hypothetical protein [Pirellulales bacterium]
MSRIITAGLFGLALAAVVAVSIGPAWARSGGGGGGGGGGRGGGGGGGGRGISAPSGGARSFSAPSGGARAFSAPGGARTFSGPSGVRTFVGPNGGERNFNRGNWAFENRNWSNGGWNRGWNGGWNGRNNGWWWWGVAPLLGAYWGDWYPGYWNGYSGYPAYYGYDYAQPDYYAMNQPSGGVEASQSTTAAAGDNQYLDEAITDFQNGNYREAQRLAGHAIVDDPQNAEAHALICLTAFATGNYQVAAAEAHAVASIRGVPSWGQIYGFYNDVDRFTSQLRPLEKFVREHPKDASGQFLVGFLYMAIGHRAEAQEHLAQVVDQMPKDRIAQNLLGEVGGQVPTTASRPSRPEGLEGTGPAPVNPNQPGAPNPPTQDRGNLPGNTRSGPPTGEPLPAPAGPRT